MRDLAKRTVIGLGLETPARRALHQTRRTRAALTSWFAGRSRSAAIAGTTKSASLASKLSHAELYSRDRDAKDNEHLRLLLSFTLRADANCIDVGAHEGTCLREILRVAPRGHHIAYEPLPDFADRLRKNFPGVDVREMALSTDDGETSFVYVPELPGYSGLRERAYPHEVKTTTINVRKQRLDAHLPADRRVDFIKIDVEGAEALVLEGAIGILKRDRPLIVFEHGPGASERYGVSSAELYTLLTDTGYRIFDLDGNGPYDRGEFEDAFRRGERWNYVARV
jgi:FkbM family methyltransferase